jgi:hypothetical protein
VTGPWIVLVAGQTIMTLLLVVIVLGMHRQFQELANGRGARVGSLNLTGLSRGQHVPLFDAVDVEGRTWTSLPVAGPLLILLTSPGCEPCARLLAALSQTAEPELGLPLLMVLPDTAASRDVHVPAWSHLLFQRSASVSAAFMSAATPHLFLVDADSRVIDSVVPGDLADLQRLAATRVSVNA